MRCQELFLTEDAVDDLVELEAYVLTYQNISFVEVLEDRFFEAFHGLLARQTTIPSISLSHLCQRFTPIGASMSITTRSFTTSTTSR